MLRDGAADEGYAIAVANDPFYWQSGNDSWFIDAAFGIAERSKIEGVLAWAAHAGAGTQGAGKSRSSSAAHTRPVGATQPCRAKALSEEGPLVKSCSG
jgi:hypothetical protein